MTANISMSWISYLRSTGDRLVERKAAGCHLSSVCDNCSRTAPVATPEPSAMTRKGSSSVARVSTGEDVMDFVRGHSLTTPTSAHLRSPPTYIHISLLSRFIHILTIPYFLLRHLRPSEMSRYIFHSPSSSFHTVPFPFSTILQPSQTCPRVS